MNRYLIGALLAVLFSVQCADGQESLEQRVSRLEQEVRELRARLGLDTAAVPTPVAVPTVLAGNDNIKYGYPGGRGTILVKQYYVILHEDSLRIPAWVTYHLTRQELQGTTANRKNNFRPDPDLPVGMRAELVDYRSSGYDRGHLAPAGDFKRSEEAMSETFYLSNMAPQRPTLNRGMWEKLEEQVRSLVGSHGSVWIVTGTLFLDSIQHPTEPETFIGPNSVAVPTHFYKAILCEHLDGTHEMFAFIMQNRNTTLPGQPKDYVVSVRSIERLTGLDFFNLLPRLEQDSLETHINSNWPPQ